MLLSSHELEIYMVENLHSVASQIRNLNFVWHPPLRYRSDIFIINVWSIPLLAGVIDTNFPPLSFNLYSEWSYIKVHDIHTSPTLLRTAAWSA